MIESDTIKLLRECDAGIKMGVKSIEQVWKYARSMELKRALENSRKEHEKLEKVIRKALDRFSDQGKNPSKMAETMSWLKTNVSLTFDDEDSTIADLMTDGCNMGIKSLRRYLNQYKAADEDSKTIAEKLIDSKKKLMESMADFL